MSSRQSPLVNIQRKIWQGRIPLEITLDASECRTFNSQDPYLISVPRLSYLPLILPRLHAFFKNLLIDPSATEAHLGWFSCESVPLKWHYPIGLLFDIYAGAEPATGKSRSRRHFGQTHRHQSSRDTIPEELENDDGEDDADADAGREAPPPDPIPWKLTVHFGNWPEDQLVKLDEEGKVLHDAFINSVKEADHLRNGTARGIMSLSKEDSGDLWRGVKENDLALYLKSSTTLVPPPHQPFTFRNIPIRIYIPSPPPSEDADAEENLKPDSARGSPMPRALASPTASPSLETSSPNRASPALRSRSRHQPQIRILQTPIPPTLPGTRTSQTLGMTLKDLLPTLFPSRRTPVLARAVLHGAEVPLSADLAELGRIATYADGWLGLVIKLL